MGAFAVSEEAIARLGKSTVEAVRYPEELAEGYMASMEVFHQLHCVVGLSSFFGRGGGSVEVLTSGVQDLLRRRIYIDYYSKKNPDFWASPTTPTHVGTSSLPFPSLTFSHLPSQPPSLFLLHLTKKQTTASRCCAKC